MNPGELPCVEHVRARRVGRPWRRVGGQEAGSATVLVAGVMSVILTLLVGLLALGSAAILAHRARAGADLAALAAADRRLQGATAGSTCAAATEAAQLNGVVIDSCEVRADVVQVVAVAVIELGWWGSGQPLRAQATARAGPPLAPL
ncbi:MAG: hypothetical protein IPM90_00745 [Austwickia sp.]|nr:hypothetical protein [Austwickia sp.]